MTYCRKDGWAGRCPRCNGVDCLPGLMKTASDALSEAGLGVPEFEMRTDKLQAEASAALADFVAQPIPDRAICVCDAVNENGHIARCKNNPSGGGKLAGDHYYRVDVAEPMSPEIKPYTAECADIIEALGMTFNEGEAFKALWRLAAQRQGRGKPGGKPQYDADKVAHYGARVAAQVRKTTLPPR